MGDFTILSLWVFVAIASITGALRLVSGLVERDSERAFRHALALLFTIGGIIWYGFMLQDVYKMQDALIAAQAAVGG